MTYQNRAQSAQQGIYYIVPPFSILWQQMGRSLQQIYIAQMAFGVFTIDFWARFTPKIKSGFFFNFNPVTPLFLNFMKTIENLIVIQNTFMCHVKNEDLDLWQPTKCSGYLSVKSFSIYTSPTQLVICMGNLWVFLAVPIPIPAVGNLQVVCPN